MNRFVFFLARRHMRRRPLQSTLTVLGVAVGVMVLVTALSLTNGFINEIISSTLRATPHITLESFDARGTLPEDAATLDAIRQTPGVVAASPFVQSQAIITRRADTDRGISGSSGFALIYGVDPAREREVLDIEVLDSAVTDLEDGGIILGEALARSMGVFPGDEIFAINAQQRRTSFLVAGTFSVGNALFDSQLAFVSLPALQNYERLDGEINGYHVRTDDPQRARQVGRQLSAELDLFPSTWEGLFSNLIEQLRLQKALIGVVVFLIVLVAAMGIANILVLTVAEKTEEIAILRALGSSRRQILAVFTLEGLLLGGGGTLLGVTLGLLLSLYFRFQPYPLPGDLYFITRLPVQLQAWDFIWVCSVAVATSVVAGLVPARRASRLDPASVLR